MLTTFTGLLDRLIIQNDYNRILLFSGEDGFEFYDDKQKQGSQISRLLMIENKADINISEIAIRTKTVLRNMDTDAVWTYKTNNGAGFLRGHESILIRVADQIQFEKILAMNADKIPSTLNFECRIEYSTLARQRITYAYEIEVFNDWRIEVKKDGIENVADISQEIILVPTTFRNLQDSISGIDRSAYSWEKMGQAQMRGIMQQYGMQSIEKNHTLSEQTDADNTR